MNDFTVPHNEEQGKAEKFNPKSMSDRQELAKDIAAWATADDSVKSSLATSWEEITDSYFNRQPERVITGYIEEPSHIAVPLQSSKLVALIDYVAGSIVNPVPYYVATSPGQDYGATKAVEDTVQWLLARADFATKVWQNVEQVALYNRSAYMVDWVETLKNSPEAMTGEAGVDDVEYSECGIRVKVIHPKDFIVYPNNVENVGEAVFCGYRARRTLRQVRALQEAPNGDDAYYFQTESLSTTTENDIGIVDEAGSPDILFENKEDEPVKIIIGCAKLDLERTGKSRVYWVEVAEDSNELLRLAPWEYHRPPFFVPCFRPTYGEFLTEDSVGKRLMPAQKMATESTNLMLDGTLMGAFPAGFYKREAGLPDEMNNYQPGALYAVDAMPDIQWIQPSFNPAMLQNIATIAESMGSQIVSIGDVATGAQYNPNTTASAVNAIEQAKSVSTNSYLARYAGKEMDELADYVRHLAYENFETLMAVYGIAMPCQVKEDLAIKCDWTINGRNQSGSPDAQAQTIEKIMSMAVSLGFGALVPGLFKALIETSGIQNKQELLSIIEQQESAQQQEPSMDGMDGAVPPGMDGMSPMPGEQFA